MKKNIFTIIFFVPLFLITFCNAISFSDFYKLIKKEQPQGSKPAQPKDKVALMSIEGTIESGKNIVGQLMLIKKDPTIKALIVHMNCNGSRVATGEGIYREIKKLSTLKPVIVFVENVCLSGGYYIAAGADWIVALPSSEIGAVGIKATLEKRKDIKFTQNGYSGNADMFVIRAGSYKDRANVYTPFEQKDIDLLKEQIDKLYIVFVDNIAQARGLSVEDEKIWADGKEFIGTEALELGLIDQIGSFSDALEKLKELLAQKEIILEDDFEIVDIKI